MGRPRCLSTFPGWIASETARSAAISRSCVADDCRPRPAWWSATPLPNAPSRYGRGAANIDVFTETHRSWPHTTLSALVLFVGFMGQADRSLAAAADRFRGAFAE